MDSKVCWKCKVVKPISEFPLQNSPPARSHRCRKCMRASQLAWYHRTKHLRGIGSRIKAMSPEQRRIRTRELERIRYRKERSAMGLEVKPPRIGPISKEQLRLEMLERCRKYRARHLERKRKSARDWGRRNRKAIRVRANHRYKTEHRYNLVTKVRRRIYMAIKHANAGTMKRDKTINLLGCSFDQLKPHIESLFTDGMSWDKVMSGEIHLDHIKPIAAFKNLNNLEEQKQAFSYLNMQPLWAKDNFLKHAKFTPASSA